MLSSVPRERDMAASPPPGSGNGPRFPAHAAKRVLFWLIALAIPMGFLEMLGLTATRLAPEMFDHREATISSLSEHEFKRFQEFYASRTLGWDNPASTARRIRNCANADIIYTYDQNRIPIHDAAHTRDAVVLIAGDSYTEGAEVADDVTFPAALERFLAVPVANLGVGGYGPDQAILKLEELIDRFPKARVLVLAVMYRDAQRMLNSYRPIMFGATDIRFGLKPYVRGEAFVGIPGGDPYRDFPSMLMAANSAFDNDFWRRPQPHFPFSVALVKAALSPANWYPALNLVLTALGWPDERLFYSLPPTRRALRAIYDRFADLAQSRHLAAAIVFVPAGNADRTSG